MNVHSDAFSVARVPGCAARAGGGPRQPRLFSEKERASVQSAPEHGLVPPQAGGRAAMMVRVDEELSAELLERARRDQAARTSLRPGHGMPEWEAAVAPVDRDNTARMRGGQRQLASA